VRLSLLKRSVLSHSQSLMLESGEGGKIGIDVNAAQLSQLFLAIANLDMSSDAPAL
jgi:hypothetical protein